MKREIFFLLSFITFIVTVTLCPSSSIAAGKFRYTLIAAAYEDPASLDPHAVQDLVSLLPIMNIYDKLVSHKGQTVEIEPRLATSWTVSNDGKTWTFKLRKGVKFQDGSPFNAEAVKYSFERLIKLGKGPASLFSEIDNITIQDDYTVLFHLKNPYGPLLSVLANTKGGYIMSPSWVKQHEVNGDMGAKYTNDHTNGTGPYMLQRFSLGQEIVLTRNKNYWGGWPKNKYLDTVVLKVIREEIGLRLALKSGEVDFLSRSLSPEEFNQLKGDANINTFETKGLSVDYICFNCSKPPLDNPKLRKAIAYAYDYKSVIEDIMKGKYEDMKMIGPLSRNRWSHNPNVIQYKRDLDKAGQLLKEAGYKPGELTIKIDYKSGVRYVDQQMQVLASNLSEVGINAKLNTMTYSALVAKWKNPSTRGDIFTMYESTPISDPFGSLDALFHSGAYYNLTGYKNDELDRVLDQARMSIDQESRKKLYEKAQEIIANDAPMIFAFELPGLFAARKYVKGLVFNPVMSESWEFKTMYIEE